MIKFEFTQNQSGQNIWSETPVKTYTEDRPLTGIELSRKIHREGTDIPFVVGKMIGELFRNNETAQSNQTCEYGLSNKHANIVKKKYGCLNFIWNPLQDIYQYFSYKIDENFISLNNAVHRAILQNNAEEVKNINNLRELIDQTNVEGESPLILATKLRQANIVAFLLKKGAWVNQPDNDGRMALYYAYKNHDHETIAILQSKNALIDIHQTSKKHMQVQFGFMKEVKDYLDKNEDLHEINNQGKTPLKGLIDNISTQPKASQKNIIETFKMILEFDHNPFAGHDVNLIRYLKSNLYNSRNLDSLGCLKQLLNITVNHFKKKYNLQGIEDYTLFGKKKEGINSGGIYQKHNKKYLIKYNHRLAIGVLIEYISSGIMQKILGNNASKSNILLLDSGDLANVIEFNEKFKPLFQYKNQQNSINCKNREIQKQVLVFLAIYLIDDYDNHFGNLGLVEEQGSCSIMKVDYDFSFAKAFFKYHWHSGMLYAPQPNESNPEDLNKWIQSIFDVIEKETGIKLNLDNFEKALSQILTTPKEELINIITERLNAFQEIYQAMNIPILLNYDQPQEKKLSAKNYRPKDFIELKKQMIINLEDRYEALTHLHKTIGLSQNKKSNNRPV